MSILCNRSTHMPNKPECQQKGLNWSISFIFGPFIGYQRLGDLLIRVLSWSSFNERGAGELLAGNTRICSRANKNNSRKRGEDTRWGRGWGQPGGSLVPWTALHVRSFPHDLVMGGISHNGSWQIILFAVKDGEALYSQQKQDQELTVAQIMNSLLPNSDLNWRK